VFTKWAHRIITLKPRTRTKMLTRNGTTFAPGVYAEHVHIINGFDILFLKMQGWQT
jgi:hypothetical protein